VERQLALWALEEGQRHGARSIIDHRHRLLVRMTEYDLVCNRVQNHARAQVDRDVKVQRIKATRYCGSLDELAWLQSQPSLADEVSTCAGQASAGCTDLALAV